MITMSEPDSTAARKTTAAAIKAMRWKAFLSRTWTDTR